MHPAKGGTMKYLDLKLARIRSGAYQPQDFILADAKDAEMAFCLQAPGPARDASGNLLSATADRAAYLQAMREMTRSSRIDILLTSVSAAEILSQEGLFAESPVTLAVRFNDTTDIWCQRGGGYLQSPSRPFRTARLEKLRTLADLGLYSVTFSNDLDHDLRTLEAYSAFRAEAADLGLRHFLEVFNPVFDVGIPAAEIGLYIGDSIVRSLAGVMAAEQPVFLKIAYNGRRAMEQLAHYDPARLVVGILGGSKGTSRDTFELLARAEQAGARVGLFGRKINYAESPLALMALMRRVLERELTPLEAVRLYHETLAEKGIRPVLSLADDQQLSDPILKAEA
jgi:hypothetical protein